MHCVGREREGRAGGRRGTSGGAVADARYERDVVEEPGAGRAWREGARDELEDGVSQGDAVHGDGAHADLKVGEPEGAVLVERFHVAEVEGALGDGDADDAVALDCGGNLRALRDTVSRAREKFEARRGRDDAVDHVGDEGVNERHRDGRVDGLGEELDHSRRGGAVTVDGRRGGEHLVDEVLEEVKIERPRSLLLGDVHAETLDHAGERLLRDRLSGLVTLPLQGISRR